MLSAGLVVVGRLRIIPTLAAMGALALASRALGAPADEAPDVTIRFSSTATTAFEPAPEPEGLNLTRLVALALDDSFQVKVSQREVDQARALRELAISLAYPRGTAQVVFGGPTPEAKTTVKNDISTVTESSLGGDLDFGELGVTVRGGVQALVPIYTFGQIDNAKQATEHLVDAAKHQVTSVRAQVVLDLTRAYWGWQLLSSLLESLEEGQNRLEGVLEQIEELLDNDSPQVTENDRLRLEFALSTLAVRRAEAEGGLAQVAQAIRILIGRPQRAALELRRERLEAAVPDELPSVEGLVAAAQGERPELLALRKVVEAQRAYKALRVAQVFPSFFFGGFLNFAYTSNATDQTNPFIRDPFNDFDVALGLGMQLELDVFTKLAQIEQADADMNLRKQQEVLATEAAELEVRSLHAQIAAEMEQTRKLERANLSARGWLTASTLAYDIGAGRADELIDAFLAWATSEAELQSTRYDNLVHFTELARATGRLVESRRRAD